ncbi:hypothetical protein [Acidiphilium sp.]|uniref:hypothetical protein n=1 Tax=Acidiphilium sp. TaxID=527 RepID=UPI003D01E907
MTVTRSPVNRRLVLIGGGHSHVEVLRRFGVDRLADVHVTVIGRDRHTPYSGMLRGLIAGLYGFDDTHIDLDRLCGFAAASTGVRLDETIGLDPDRTPAVFDVFVDQYRVDVMTWWCARATEQDASVKLIGRFPSCADGAFRAGDGAPGRSRSPRLGG